MIKYMDTQSTENDSSSSQSIFFMRELERLHCEVGGIRMPGEEAMSERASAVGRTPRALTPPHRGVGVGT